MAKVAKTKIKHSNRSQMEKISFNSTADFGCIDKKK